MKGYLKSKAISNTHGGRKGRVESWIFLYRKLFLGSMPQCMALCVSL